MLKGPTQPKYAFTALDLSNSGLTGGEYDEVSADEIKSRRLQGRENAILSIEAFFAKLTNGSVRSGQNQARP